MRRHMIIPALIAASALALGACSSDTKSTEVSPDSTGTTAGAETATPADPGTSTAGSTSTGNGGAATASGPCALVPGVADIESIVGVTVGDGVSASDGVCAFSDAEATTSISFNSVTDPTSVANFAALGADSGATDLAEAALPGAKAQFGTVLYADADTLYSVSVTSDSASSADTLQQSTALMELWVSGD